MQNFHIVNGDLLKDSLKNKYPSILVMREALIHGPLSASDEQEFFTKRADFFSQEYNVCTKQAYLEGAQEFHKMMAIPPNSMIHFWFGKDVFCQVNFWYLLEYLQEQIKTSKSYLVLPEGNDCSFASPEAKSKALSQKNFCHYLISIVFVNCGDYLQQKIIQKCKSTLLNYWVSIVL